MVFGHVSGLGLKALEKGAERVASQHAQFLSLADSTQHSSGACLFRRQSSPASCVPTALCGVGHMGPWTEGVGPCGLLTPQHVEFLGRHFPTVAINDPEAELEIPVFSRRFWKPPYK